MLQVKGGHKRTILQVHKRVAPLNEAALNFKENGVMEVENRRPSKLLRKVDKVH